MSVGALPTEKVGVLIKKYGPNGTHLDAQKAAVERLAKKRARVIPAPKAKPAPAPEAEAPAEKPAE